MAQTCNWSGRHDRCALSSTCGMHATLVLLLWRPLELLLLLELLVLELLLLLLLLLLHQRLLHQTLMVLPASRGSSETHEVCVCVCVCVCVGTAG